MKLKDIYDYFKNNKDYYYPFELEHKNYSDTVFLEIWLDCNPAKAKEKIAEVYQYSSLDSSVIIRYYIWDDEFVFANSRSIDLPEDEDKCINIFIDKIENMIETEQKRFDLFLQCIGYYRMQS